MGTMSASDAAPLPRLGEVFFDVRGNSRSMRLSWYADTGVAVLSIWQGGMCTGTFRLAIADLPRMVETLQRGPGAQQPGWDGETPGQAFAGPPGDATAQGHAMGPMSGQMMQPGPADFPGGHPDYLAESPGPRTGVSEYAAAPAGYPGEPQPPQPQDRRRGAPDYLADPLEALGQLGVPEAAGPPSAPYQTSAREYPAEQPPAGPTRPADYLTGPPPGERPRPPADYLTGPPPDTRPAPGEYLTGPPPASPARPADYLPGPPSGERPRPPADYLTGPPPDQRARPADYLTGPMPDARPQPPDYLPAPPEQQTPPAGYPSGPSGYPSTPPDQRTEYLTDPPGAPNYPGAGDGGAYPQYTGRQAPYQGEPASDPYLAATGSMDYQGPPPVSNYPHRSSAPRSASRSARRPAPRSAGHEDALGPTTADYPVHYGTAVTDDMSDEPPVESLPYQPRRGGR
jgi:hypothetical protein